MKKLYVKACAFLMILINVCSCNQSKIQNADIESVKKFDTLQVNERYCMVSDIENTELTIELLFINPTEYGNNTQLKKIQQQVSSSFFGDDYSQLLPSIAAKRLIKDELSNYEEEFESVTIIPDEKEDIPDDYEWFAHYMYSSCMVLIFNKSDYLSYSIQSVFYSGGAHPGHSFTNHTIDLRKGELIHEQDIFKENYTEPLTKIIIKELAKKYGVKDVVKLGEETSINVDDIRPNDNFYIDDKGITYTFNEYEIAAYAVGKIDVTIPFAQIKELLRKPLL